jgi:protein-S-isoprenylcysteine O-methyltransferase Ste14
MRSQAWAVGAFLLVAVVERLYERQFSERAERGDVKMRWSYIWFHVLHGALYVLSGLEFYYWRWGAGFSWLAFAVGVGLFALSLWLRLTAIRTLGRMWSLNLEIRQGHQLVQAGVYRWMRHPAYTAIMLEVVAIPLAANAWGSLVLPLGLYVPLLLARWWREEQEMSAKFGEAYRQYRRQVCAFVPLRRLPPPNSVQ